MSTISSTTTNPYLVGYSTSDIIGTDTVLQNAATTSSTSSSTSTSTDSYSDSVLSTMSGFDVNSMVNEMMTSDYTKLNQLLGTEQTNQWTEDRERGVITNLNNFGSTYFEPDGSNYVLSSNSFLAYTATPSSTTDITSTALNTAQAGNYTISTNNLATASSITNTPVTTGIANSSLFSTINGGSTSGTIALTVNGTSVNYAYNSNSTIGTVMSGLSAASGENFSYSELTNSFSATSTTTGSASTLTIASADTAGSATNEFLTDAYGYDTSGTTTSAVATAGKNGSFNITEPNGTTATTVSESSNSFTIDGLNYNVTGAIASTLPVTINVASNVSGVVSQIQSFVTAYNNLTTGIDSATSETIKSTYPTLTYAQESKMTAAQITSWNNESQQGDLSNNSNIMNLQNSMRSAFSDMVSGSGLTMADLGLSTSNTTDATQAGVLTLNVSTLTAALKSNPNAVINQFTQASASYPNGPTATLGTADYSTQAQTKYNEEGIFQRLSDIVTQYASVIPVGTSGSSRGLLVNEAGLATDPTDTSTIGQSLTDEATAVTNFKTQITTDKTNYTTQYTALQAALSKMSTEGSEITSMLGSSSSS